MLRWLSRVRVSPVIIFSLIYRVNTSPWQFSARMSANTRANTLPVLCNHRSDYIVTLTLLELVISYIPRCRQPAAKCRFTTVRGTRKENRFSANRSLDVPLQDQHEIHRRKFISCEIFREILEKLRHYLNILTCSTKLAVLSINKL